MELFWSKVDASGDCWEWKAHRSQGYGQVGSRAWGTRIAHRVAYELLVGPIPDGLQIDHLCRNRGCVNPDHLEPVTGRVNTLRGATFQARNAAKTQCQLGHAYTTNKSGSRYCQICQNAKRQRARYAARQAMEVAA